MIMTFNDYKNNTLLESIRKLKLIHKILKLAKFKNKLVINGEDSKIYLKSNNHNSDIEGAIIYPVANKIAFRIQNKLDFFKIQIRMQNYAMCVPAVSGRSTLALAVLFAIY